MRRRDSLATITAALLLAAGAGSARAQGGTLRIGYQKYGVLILLKERGTLEPRLEPMGFDVTWTEFPAGPQLLEGLNVGAIDVGHTGEAPPVFAQAAGAPLRYIGVRPSAPRSEAIIVPADSPIRSVADLKGRTVALNKGSNVHFLLVKALQASGLAYGDITTAFLPPADARAAFESGQVDAWAIWDPFLAAAEATTGARQITDGTGLVANHEFVESTDAFATAHPEVVTALLEELDATETWAQGDQEEVARLTAPRVGIPAAILQTALGRMSYGVKPVSDEVAAAQQVIADTFHELKLLPKPIVVRDAVWRAGS